MEPTGYWERIVQARLSRRRLIAGASTAGAAALALSLVDCGGGSSSSSKPDNTARREGKGLLSTIEDTTASAKQGGTLRYFRTADPVTFDPLTSDDAATSNWGQSKMTIGMPVRLGAYDGGRQGDVAESWEVSKDGLQWTFKLRPNVVIQNLPGGKRNLDTQDILYAYNRYKKLGEYRTTLSNEAGPAGAVSSMEAPDNKTIVMKLAFPFPGLLSALDYLYMVPRESDGGYDPKGKQVGSGPWMVEEYQPSAYLHYARNPDWHFKGKPFADKVELPILPEYATRVAQFRANRINFGVLRQEDIIPTKKDLSQLNLYSIGYTTQSTGDMYHLVYGLRPNSPFKDDRVRQAASMGIDRDTWIDVFYNVSKFHAEGLDVAQRYYSHFGLQPDQFWLDPKGKDFGPNAKYFQYDAAEAKKLMSAAGFGSGFKTTFTHTAPAPATAVQSWIDMLKQNLGWEIADLPRTGETGPTSANLLNMRGDFDGFTVSGLAQRPDPGVYMYHKYASNGSSSRLPAGVDPEMDRLFESELKEPDPKKRVDAIHEVQRYLGGKQWYLVMPGGAERFDLAWPSLKNYGVFTGTNIDVQGTELLALNYWLDQTAS